MKVRDSGMPEESYWETLFDIPLILDGLAVDAQVRDVVEIGCGYGTFTVPAAQRIKGELHSFDIDPQMITRTRARLENEGVKNVRLMHRDVIGEGFGLPAASIDAVLLFNILHAENPSGMLHASAELLRPGGRVLVIHWRSDIATPRGPDLSIRPRPEQILAWAADTQRLVPEGAARVFPPWHYGVILRRH